MINYAALNPTTIPDYSEYNNLFNQLLAGYKNKYNPQPSQEKQAALQSIMQPFGDENQ